MDWLYNIYHTLVDFFLIFIYFFQKLGAFLGKLFNLLISPFRFLKDFITNINLGVAPAQLSFSFPFVNNSVISTIFLDAFIFILIMLLAIKRILRE
jgi:hypothetical protein